MQARGTLAQLSESAVPAQASKTKEAVNAATEKLIQSLEAGHSDTLKQYLTAMAQFHRYSLHNVLLIVSQRPNATHCAGFQTWKKLGRYVRRGEKGILILAPCLRKFEAERESESGELETITGQKLVGFRAVYVFDVAQTDGKELPQLSTVRGSCAGYIAHLKQFIAECGIELEYTDAILPARGVSLGKKIQIIPGMSEAEQFSTLAHELAHELLHRSDRRNETDKRIRETEAESVAYVVCHAIGLQTGTAAQDYIGLYRGDANLLIESLKYVQEAASKVLDAILPPGVSE